MATTNSFDVVVIGAGPGGYVAAIRAAQLGFSTACIDEWKNDKGGPAPGGTCTNIGCIPSKALLQSSENFEDAGHHFADHGIGLTNLTIDVATMMARKKTVVKQNNDGIVYLFKKNKIQFFHGRGSFARKGEGGWEIAVSGAKAETLVAKHVIVATGSQRARLARCAPFDERDDPSRTTAHWPSTTMPKTLGIVGSGVIGLEMGSVWRRLGADVTILEALPTFLGAVDAQIAAEAYKVFARQGLKDRTRRQDHRRRGGRRRRLGRLHRCGRRSADAGLREADRLDRPPAQHHRPQWRSGRPRPRQAGFRQRRR